MGKHITSTMFVKLIAAQPKANYGQWTSVLRKSGKGDYGTIETFRLDGVDIASIEIDYTSGGRATFRDLIN